MNLLLTAGERSSLRRVLRLLEVDRPRLVLSVLLGALGLGSAIALAATSAWLIARASQMPPVLYLTVAVTSVRMFGILRALMRYLQRLASHTVALRGMDSLRANIYDRLSLTGLQRTVGLRRGDLLARTGADVDDVGDFVVKALLPALVTGVVGVGTVAGIAMLSPAAAAILAACLLVSGVVAPLLAARAARRSEDLSVRARSQLSDATLTLMDGGAELQVSGGVADVLDTFDQAQRRLRDATARTSLVAGAAAGLDHLAMGAAVVGALLVGIPQTNAGTVAAVALAVLALTPLAAFEGTSDMAGAAIQTVRSARAAVRIDQLLGREPVPELGPIPPEGPPTRTGGSESPVPAGVPRVAPDLRARSLRIGWQGHVPVATGIDLDLRPGRSVAVVGPSGIGKSTLLYTLCGLLPPQGGSATLDDVEVSTALRPDVAHRVTMTAEDAHVFATTVLENLRVADPSVDVPRARAVLARVGLGDWLDSLPAGTDTLIGSGGTTISGGERRRLLLARALCAPSPLLLLDEPVEHLDAANADRVMGVLAALTGDGRGVLAVTHRLTGLQAFDEVVVMGRPEGDPDAPAVVTARGTHRQLIDTVPAYRRALEQEARR